MKKVVAFVVLMVICWGITATWDATQPVLQTHVALQQMERSDTAAVAVRASRQFYQTGGFIAGTVFLVGVLVIFGKDIAKGIKAMKEHVNNGKETF